MKLNTYFCLSFGLLSSCGPTNTKSGQSQLSAAEPKTVQGFVNLATGSLKTTFLDFGDYVVLDDMVIPKSRTSLTKPKSLGLVGITDDHKWPTREIPVEIPAGFLGESEARAVLEQWNQKTVLKFVPRTTETEYIAFTNATTDFSRNDPCGVSYLGWVHKGKQELYVSPNRTNCISIGATLSHELAHAVGVAHEHSRCDRDNFITLHPENIRPASLNQFDKIDCRLEKNKTPYDPGAITHYSAFTGSAEGKPSITLKNGSTVLGQNTDGKLTDNDVAGIAAMYASVNGGWGPWKDNIACTGNDTVRKETRICNNPVPKYGGSDCLPPAEQTVTCDGSPVPLAPPTPAPKPTVAEPTPTSAPTPTVAAPAPTSTPASTISEPNSAPSPAPTVSAPDTVGQKCEIMSQGVNGVSQSTFASPVLLSPQKCRHYCIHFGGLLLLNFGNMLSCQSAGVKLFGMNKEKQDNK